ncbi:hypothetical protein GF406_23785 [candidate division KSB1 bacterium]|jgi:hypothetical protein|nr:hypothetical protein [candidate division KSB1 bacterium]
MGERELILALAATIFFSTISLSVNRYFLETNELMWKNEYDYYAVGLGQRIIEEAKTRRFDLNSPPLYNFESPYGMNCANGENYPNFNDVDDYGHYGHNDNLHLIFNTPLGEFRLRIYVHYVDKNNIDTPVYYRTYHKRMVVVVKNENLSAPIILKHVFSYIENN